MTGPHCAGCGYVRSLHGADGGCPGLKTKTFTARAPVEEIDWREVMRRDRVAASAPPVAVAAVAAPLIPARPPLSFGEYAGGQGRQAVGLGRAAMAVGWSVSPWYWLAGDGTEGCALRLARGTLRAVATWKRPSGMLGSSKGWASDLAYAWRTDVARIPQKMTVTQLEGLIRERSADRP